jgi:small subunit ribosomal protein S9
VIKSGSGHVDVHDRESPVLFAQPVLRMLINQSLVASNRVGQSDG